MTRSERGEIVLRPGDLRIVDVVLRAWRKQTESDREAFLCDLMRTAMQLGGLQARAWLDDQLNRPPLSFDWNSIFTPEVMAELTRELDRRRK